MREGDVVELGEDVARDQKSVVTDKRACHNKQNKIQIRREGGTSLNYHYDFLKRCLIKLSHVVSCRPYLKP
jgi:hypothetical protein